MTHKGDGRRINTSLMIKKGDGCRVYASLITLISDEPTYIPSSFMIFLWAMCSIFDRQQCEFIKQSKK